MPLDEQTITHLRRIREEVEELLNEAKDIIPPDFRLTCVLRYCGTDPDVKNMIWTEDVHDDVMRALLEERDNMEDAA